MIDCARIQCLPIREIEAKLQVSDSTIDRVLQKFKSEILKQPPVPSNSANRLELYGFILLVASPNVKLQCSRINFNVIANR
jgi:hypothetical protein